LSYDKKMPSEKQPIFILPENTERTMGKDAQRNNILAAKLVSEAVKKKHLGWIDNRFEWEETDSVCGYDCTPKEFYETKREKINGEAT